MCVGPYGLIKMLDSSNMGKRLQSDQINTPQGKNYGDKNIECCGWRENYILESYVKIKKSTRRRRD